MLGLSLTAQTIFDDMLAIAIRFDMDTYFRVNSDSIESYADIKDVDSHEVGYWDFYVTRSGYIYSVGWRGKLTLVAVDY